MSALRPALYLVLTLTAQPLAAQVAPCGPDGESGQWLAGSEAASDIATADDFGEQMALVLTGNSFVGLFSVSAATDVRIEAAGRGNGDPTLTLLGPDGTEIATDDDSGGNGAARIEMPLDPGTYCAVVRSFDDSPMAAFVRVGRSEMEALTPGLTGMPEQTGADAREGCDTARDLGTLDTTTLAVTAPAAEMPFARFTLTSPTAVSVTASNADADPAVKLLDATGGTLAENDDFDGLNARIDQSAPLAPGTYCIALSAISDDTQAIDLAVSVYDAAAARQGLYDRGEAAPPLDGSIAVTDLGSVKGGLQRDLQVGGTAQWFSVTTDGPGLLLAEAIGAGDASDPWLILFDAAGREIAQNDDSGGGTDAMIAARIMAGTYLIGLKQVGDHSGFARLLVERYVPAP